MAMDLYNAIETWLLQYLPELWVFLLIRTVQIVALIVTLIICVAFLTLIERKVIGYMQNRIGPNRVGPRGLLQPFADVIKLLMKEIVVPARSNRFLFIVFCLLRPSICLFELL